MKNKKQKLTNAVMNMPMSVKDILAEKTIGNILKDNDKLVNMLDSFATDEEAFDALSYEEVYGRFDIMLLKAVEMLPSVKKLYIVQSLLARWETLEPTHINGITMAQFFPFRALGQILKVPDVEALHPKLLTGLLYCCLTDKGKPPYLEEVQAVVCLRLIKEYCSFRFHRSRSEIFFYDGDSPIFLGIGSGPKGTHSVNRIPCYSLVQFIKTILADPYIMYVNIMTMDAWSNLLSFRVPCYNPVVHSWQPPTPAESALWSRIDQDTIDKYATWYVHGTFARTSEKDGNILVSEILHSTGYSPYFVQKLIRALHERERHHHGNVNQFLLQFALAYKRYVWMSKVHLIINA